MKIYTVKLPGANDANIYKWLSDHIGAGICENRNAWADPNIKWAMWQHLYINGQMRANYAHFEFRTEQDAMLFKMRWL